MITDSAQIIYRFLLKTSHVPGAQSPNYNLGITTVGLRSIENECLLASPQASIQNSYSSLSNTKELCLT